MVLSGHQELELNSRSLKPGKGLFEFYLLIYNYAGFIFTDKKNFKKITHNKFFLEAPVFCTPGTDLTLRRFCLTRC